MLGLCLLLILIVATSGADPELNSIATGCENRLDVICSGRWPILRGFSRELTDNALLVAVGFQRYVVDHVRQFTNRAVLHDRHNKTYLHELYPDYNVPNWPYITRELVEISGLSVKDIKFGEEFIFILTADGATWTAGINDHGQLSLHTVDRSPIFTKVQGVPPAKQIATGHSHCVVLAENGELFSWGNGYYGALGRTPVNSDSNPTPMNFRLGPGATVPTSICCSYYACMALTKDAEVFTWGSPDFIGHSGGKNQPGQVQGISSGDAIIKVACGEEHMVALSATGGLYGWGSNRRGELKFTPFHAPYATKLDLGGKVVRDVVAGRDLTIIRTDAEEAYYFGMYDGGVSQHETPLPGYFRPRDLMARSSSGQDSYGAVSLGC